MVGCLGILLDTDLRIIQIYRYPYINYIGIIAVFDILDKKAKIWHNELFFQN